MQIITVIYTDDTKPRRYVSSTSRRSGMVDNNLVALLTINPEESHDFGSITNANLIIPRIHNPFDRTYLSFSVTVDHKPADRILEGDIE